MYSDYNPVNVLAGYTADLVNFAYLIDIYKIWVDVITFNENRPYIGNERGYRCFVCRRDNVWYKHSSDDILYIP